MARSISWSPPKTVAVGCYFNFTDCVESPATAFYPVVNRQLVLMQSIPLAIVTLLLLWLTRTDDGERSRTLYSRRTRIAISLSLALAVPVVGGIPIVVYLFLLLGIISNTVSRGSFTQLGFPYLSLSPRSPSLVCSAECSSSREGKPAFGGESWPTRYYAKSSPGSVLFHMAHMASLLRISRKVVPFQDTDLSTGRYAINMQSP
jgi:hypothetical protein